MEYAEEYSRIGKLISQGSLKTLDDIFKIVPQDQIAREIQLSPAVFDRRIKDVRRFILRDRFKLAMLFHIEVEKMLEVLIAQHEKNIEPMKTAAKKKRASPAKVSRPEK